MFKYNEKAYAEHIIENGFGTKHLNQELTIMAKYFRDNPEKGKSVKESLYDFCEEKMKGEFNKVVYFKNINAAVSKAIDKDEPLVVIEEIPVTEQELQRIDGFDIDYEYKKILFTMMVLEKLNKEYYHLKTNKNKNDEHFFGGTSKNYRELVESSGISFSKRNKSKYIHKVIHDLNELGIVEIKNKGSIKLLYLYEPSSDMHPSSMLVKDFDNIGLYYDLHCKTDKVKKCETCEKPIKTTSNAVKYCNDCYENNRKHYQAEKQKLYRKNKNVYK